MIDTFDAFRAAITFMIIAWLCCWPGFSGSVRRIMTPVGAIMFGAAVLNFLIGLWSMKI